MTEIYALGRTLELFLPVGI